MIYVFLNDYFSADRGLTVERATAALVLFGVGGFIGQAFGGWYGQRLYNYEKRLQCVLMGVSTILSVGPVLYLINAPVVGDGWFYFVSLLAGLIVSINGPNVRSVLQVKMLTCVRVRASCAYANMGLCVCVYVRTIESPL
jgi:predicted MFS family arabinose efflux permease